MLISSFENNGSLSDVLKETECVFEVNVYAIDNVFMLFITYCVSNATCIWIFVQLGRYNYKTHVQGFRICKTLLGTLDRLLVIDVIY